MTDTLEYVVREIFRDYGYCPISMRIQYENGFKDIQLVTVRGNCSAGISKPRKIIMLSQYHRTILNPKENIARIPGNDRRDVTLGKIRAKLP